MYDDTADDYKYHSLRCVYRRSSKTESISFFLLLFKSYYFCNDPTIGSYNHYHLSPNGIPRGNQRWYGLVYLIQIAGKPRIRPRE